jgi:hypothetical protein
MQNISVCYITEEQIGPQSQPPQGNKIAAAQAFARLPDQD